MNSALRSRRPRLAVFIVQQVVGRVVVGYPFRLCWDAKAERVTNNDAANDLLDYEYRKPWTVRT